jgi:predicted CoA-binding protein
MSKPTVAVLGASRDRQKYGNKSLRAHLQQGYDVYPVNPRESEIEGLKCYPNLAAIPVPHLNRITVYLPPKIGIDMLEEIKARGADEVWLNPGSDSPELLSRAGQLGLNVIQACSIVDLGMSPYQL